MNGLLVFDLHNDIVFNKLNESINKKLHKLAEKHELLPSDSVSLIQRQLFVSRVNIQ